MDYFVFFMLNSFKKSLYFILNNKKPSSHFILPLTYFYSSSCIRCEPCLFSVYKKKQSFKLHLFNKDKKRYNKIELKISEFYYFFFFIGNDELNLN